MSPRHKPPAPITDPEQVAALLHALRHEIVQPLHTLGLLLDLVPAARTEKFIAWSEASNRALDNLRRMLRLLGDTAKLDLAPPVPTRQKVRLAPFLAGLAAGKRELAEEAGLSVRVSRTNRTVESDPDLLRLALDALLDNALRHGGGAVLLGVKSRGAGLLVGVWNRGAGIDADDAAYYLQDFVRGEPLAAGDDSNRLLGTGLGLGLGIARRVASLLDAEFCFSSIPGRGTVAGLLLEREPG